MDRLHAVLGAALAIALKEQNAGATSEMFLGEFRLNRQAGYPASVALCRIVEDLLVGIATFLPSSQRAKRSLFTHAFVDVPS